MCQTTNFANYFKLKCGQCGEHWKEDYFKEHPGVKACRKCFETKFCHSCTDPNKALRDEKIIRDATDAAEREKQKQLAIRNKGKTTLQLEIDALNAERSQNSSDEIE